MKLWFSFALLAFLAAVSAQAEEESRGEDPLRPYDDIKDNYDNFGNQTSKGAKDVFKGIAKVIVKGLAEGAAHGVVDNMFNQATATNQTSRAIGECSDDTDCLDDVFINSCHCKNSVCECPATPPKSPRNPNGTNY